MSSLLVFNRVCRLEIQSVMLVFFTQLCELLPFSLGHLPPSPSLYRQCVVGKGWGGEVLSCFEDHILQEFNTLFLTRFRTYKNCFTTPNKNLGGEGASDR
jgi:hypothetical protein